MKSQTTFQEKIFVHTNKHYYHAGEIAWFKIYTVDAATHKQVDISKIAYLEILDSANKPVVQGMVRLKYGKGYGSFTIPESATTGIHQVRAYTRWMKNFPPDSYFHREIVIENARTSRRSYVMITDSISLHNGNLSLAIQSDNKAYRTRQKISLAISAVDELGKPLTADLSVSVFRLDSIISADPINISDLFSGISKYNTDKIDYSPEYNGHIVVGKIVSRNTGVPQKGIDGYITIPSHGLSFYNSRSDSSGNIQFEIKNIPASDSMITQMEPRISGQYLFSIESPFSKSYATSDRSSYEAITSYPLTLLDHSIHAQVDQIYKDKTLNAFVKRKKDSIPFYQKQDMHYLLDDYTRYNRMEDVFREFIRPVNVNRRGDNFHLAVYNEPLRNVFENDPLVLLDGLPVFNIDRLFAYDPLKIKSIDVVTRKYFRGASIFEGIVDMRSYTGNFDTAIVEPGASIIEYKGVLKERHFHLPVYEQGEISEGGLPDFRSALYWNPSVVTNADGKKHLEFYASELEGIFIVIIHGLAESGEAGTARYTFTVRNP